MPWLAVKREVWNATTDKKTRALLESRYRLLFRDEVERDFMRMHAEAAEGHRRTPEWSEAEAAAIDRLREAD